MVQVLLSVKIFDARLKICYDSNVVFVHVTTATARDQFTSVIRPLSHGESK
ncbi:MAG: hypothetical protein ABGA11_08365 [Liquorilactobacillus hordei]|uniref:hypothetical protein n=1 Tax=Liquorilactobacillus hordei TaxID=468911 RepID=UPI0039EB435A